MQCAVYGLSIGRLTPQHFNHCSNAGSTCTSIFQRQSLDMTLSMCTQLLLNHCMVLATVLNSASPEQCGALGKILASALLHRSQFHNQLSYTHTETACMCSRFDFF